MRGCFRKYFGNKNSIYMQDLIILLGQDVTAMKDNPTVLREGILVVARSRFRQPWAVEAMHRDPSLAAPCSPGFPGRGGET